MSANLKQHILNTKLLTKHKGVIVELDNRETSEILDGIAKELSEGAEIVELKQIHISDNVFLETAQKTKQLCELFGATFIINNRADIAYLTSADCVNLEQKDIDIDSAGSLLKKESLIGREINTHEDMRNLVKAGADYTISTIYPAPNEPVVKTGLEYAKWVSENTLLPALIRENLSQMDCFIRYDLIVMLAEN